MNNRFSLFDNYPFLKPLDANEALHVHRLLKHLAKSRDNLAAVYIPETITDHMMLCFLKAVHEGHWTINLKAWEKFLETLFQNGHIDQIVSPSLKNYLFIQLAKKHSLSRYLDYQERLKLAYCALHSGPESRKILLMHAKHFEISDPKILADLAFKGILLGGALDIDLFQFTPQSSQILEQLLYLIAKVSPQKAEKLAIKLKQELSKDLKIIKANLKAS
jgi:hypothetical protein